MYRAPSHGQGRAGRDGSPCVPAVRGEDALLLRLAAATAPPDLFHRLWEPPGGGGYAPVTRRPGPWTPDGPRHLPRPGTSKVTFTPLAVLLTYFYLRDLPGRLSTRGVIPIPLLASSWFFLTLYRWVNRANIITSVFVFSFILNLGSNNNRFLRFVRLFVSPFQEPCSSCLVLLPTCPPTAIKWQNTSTTSRRGSSRPSRW